MPESITREQGDDAGAGHRPESWLLSELRGVRNLLLAVVVFSVGAGLLTISQARYLAEVCHRVVILGHDTAGILPLIALFLLITVSRAVLSFVIDLNASAAAARLKQSVRSHLYRLVMRRGAAGRAGWESGSLIETVSRGVDELEPYITRFIPQAILAAILPLFFLVVLLPSEWRSGLVLLFSAPFIPLFMILIGRGSESIHKRHWKRLAVLSSYLIDRVRGLPDLISCGTIKNEARVLARASEEYRSETMIVLRVAFLSAFTLEFFSTVGTAVVAVIVGFRLLSGVMELRDGLFVLLLAPEFYLPLRNLGLSYHARMQGITAADRIVGLMADAVQNRSPATGSINFEKPPTVCFEGVSFLYDGGQVGVRDIDLELPSGSITALAGESGAGKSTLGRLLIGLLTPHSGRIVVDGRDLSEISPDAWRSGLAWVPQSPYFSAGTLRENLLLGAPFAQDDEIAAALSAAAADDIVHRLPAGLETLVGDEGAGLSGGELKRLALARAYLRRASLIVMDEPTAGLDSDSEREVCRAVQSVSVGRTVLIISHREATLSCADRVVEIAGGSISRVVSPSEFCTGEGGAS